MSIKNTLNSIRKDQEKIAKVSIKKALISPEALSGGFLGLGAGSALTIPGNLNYLRASKKFRANTKRAKGRIKVLKARAKANKASGNTLLSKADMERAQRLKNLDAQVAAEYAKLPGRGFGGKNYRKTLGTTTALGYLGGVGSNIMKQKKDIEKKKQLKAIAAMLGGLGLMGGVMASKEKTASAKARAIEGLVGATGGGLAGAYAESKTRKPTYYRDQQGNIQSYVDDSPKRKLKFIGSGALGGAAKTLSFSKIKRMLQHSKNKKEVNALVTEMTKKKDTLKSELKRTPMLDPTRRTKVRKLEAAEEMERQFKNLQKSSVGAAKKEMDSTAFGGKNTSVLKTSDGRKIILPGKTTPSGQFIKSQYGGSRGFMNETKGDISGYYDKLIASKARVKDGI